MVLRSSVTSEQSALSALVAVETKHLGRYPIPDRCLGHSILVSDTGFSNATHLLMSTNLVMLMLHIC
jgi:hypothetical protein